MTFLEPSVELRRATPSDADVFASWGADETFCRAAEWPIGKPLREREISHRRLVSDSPEDLIRLSVVHHGAVVGIVDVQGTESTRRELGYLIGPSSAWGRGLGVAAARADLEFAFGTLGLETVWAEALDANVASVRILQRLGMVETGRGAPSTYRGRPTHYRQFSLDRPTAGPAPRSTGRQSGATELC